LKRPAYPQSDPPAEYDPVRAWRGERLLRLGFDPDDAGALAADRSVDLHELAALIRNGCPHDVARRIAA
jgi:hypothetical protein